MSLPKNFYNAVDVKKMGIDDIESMKNEIDSMIGLPEVTSSDAGKTLIVSDSGEWILGEAGGGSITFTKTEIADNYILDESSISFTEDYRDYPFIEVSLVDKYDGGRTCKIVTTPKIVTSIFAASNNKCCFDAYNSNVYVTVSESKDPDTKLPTWTFTNRRYMVVEYVKGIMPSKIPTFTKIYDRGSIASGQVQPTGKFRFSDYDLVFFSACTGDDTETTPNAIVMKLCGDLESEFIYPFNRYNSASVRTYKNDTRMPEEWYFVIYGYKF